MAELRGVCFSCGEQLAFFDSVSRRDECNRCGADVRVCKNCQFYDVKAYNECRETSADPVREKDRSNLCDFFKLRSGEANNAKAEKDALLAAAEALFKKSSQ